VNLRFVGGETYVGVSSAESYFIVQYMVDVKLLVSLLAHLRRTSLSLLELVAGRQIYVPPLLSRGVMQLGSNLEWIDNPECSESCCFHLASV